MHCRHARIVSEQTIGSIVVSELTYDAQCLLHHHCHLHPYLTIVLEGDYTELNDGLPERCEAGTVILHRSNEEHADFFKIQGRCLVVSMTHLDQNEHVTANARSSLSTFEARSVLRSIRRAVAGLSDEDAAQTLDRDVSVLVSSMQTQRSTANAPDWLTHSLRAFRWIDEVPLSQAASDVDVHPTHFSRAFTHHVGITPSTYRRRERVRYASDLILNTRSTLADVAQAAGFADQSHLSHAFRTLSGMTPAAYRRAFS